ncbi:mucolipin-3 [Nephila pilipes]|uniref:Mucolipin-3 n=1 Tax=Nephila pilipes TaxID=299642 RepID=A0A8X6Q356_NEPPI|nr:mucolipin-3 [Nephila pilipes]
MDTQQNVNSSGSRNTANALPYQSPYVEISQDGQFYESASSSLGNRNGSVNSFLEEAEIIREGNFSNVNQHMKKKLISFFMNPVEKWKKRGRFPWKLCVQIVNIILVTLQVCLFGYHSLRYVKQHSDMTTALSKILLKDWSEDVAVYPPSNGPYSVFTIPDFYDHIDNVIKQYAKINSISIGPFGYDSPENILTPMKFCIKQYDGQIFLSNLSVQVNGFPKEQCLTIPSLYPSDDPLWEKFSMASFLEQSNFTLNFKTLINAKLQFRLRTIFIKSLNKLDFPECYRLKLLVKYDNTEHDGQLLINMIIHSEKFNCHVDSNLVESDESVSYFLRQLLNSFVIVFCVISTILCLRSLYYGFKLARETSNFFKQYYQKELSLSELLDFIDFWYVNIVISNILLICGSLIKIQIEEQSAEGSKYAKCSILLGTGILLMWIGVFRYFEFFSKYNMLILTVKKALPNVLRFLICAVLLFTGSSFCGWIVLSPYHVKFRTLSRTIECLFSIMNGDDMFATFALLDTSFDMIWWFSRIYFYLFLLVFVYIVVSLFISVIMDTFESIKHIYLYGAPPRTTIEIFLSSGIPVSIPISPAVIADSYENNPNFFERAWDWLRHTWYSYIYQETI